MPHTTHVFSYGFCETDATARFEEQADTGTRFGLSIANEVTERMAGNSLRLTARLAVLGLKSRVSKRTSIVFPTLRHVRVFRQGGVV